MLTKKQQELLLFIHQRLREDGVAPSFDEMKDALDLKSKSGIHRLIRALEERGFIRRLPHRARALEVVRLPEAVAGRRAAREQAEPESGRIIQGNFRKPRRPELVKDHASAAASELEREFMQIPLHGKIAAGTPIEALQQAGFIKIKVVLDSATGTEVTGDAKYNDHQVIGVNPTAGSSVASSTEIIVIADSKSSVGSG